MAPGADGGRSESREDPAFPIRNYDQLPAIRIMVALSNLDLAELVEVRAHEQRGKGRENILGRIDTLIRKGTAEKATPPPDQLRVTPSAGTDTPEPPRLPPAGGPTHPGGIPATSAAVGVECALLSEWCQAGGDRCGNGGSAGGVFAGWWDAGGAGCGESGAAKWVSCGWWEAGWFSADWVTCGWWEAGWVSAGWREAGWVFC